MVRLSASRTGRLYSQKIFLVLIFTRVWVDPKVMVRSEGNMSLKNPVTPPGIDPGTVRLVVQCLNHHATPFHFKRSFFQFSIPAFQWGTLFGSQVSSVGIVTRSQAERPGIQMVAGGRSTCTDTERQTDIHTIHTRIAPYFALRFRESSLRVTVPRRGLYSSSPLLSVGGCVTQ